MKVKVKVAQSCPTFCDSMDCSLPGFSVHGILQGKILEWVAVSFSRGSSQPRDQTQVSRIADGFFTIWATKEAHSPKRVNKLPPQKQITKQADKQLAGSQTHFAVNDKLTKSDWVLSHSFGCRKSSTVWERPKVKSPPNYLKRKWVKRPTNQTNKKYGKETAEYTELCKSLRKNS